MNLLETNDLVKIPFGDAQRVSLELPEGLSLDEWKLVGRRLIRCKDSLQFWIGDWINYAHREYGTKYQGAMEAFGAEAQEEGGGYGYDQHTLECIASVARKVQSSLRRENLSFTHHKVVAALTPDEQGHWLSRAESEQMSVADLTLKIRETGKAKAVATAGTSALLGLWTWDTWFLETEKGFDNFFKRVPPDKWTDDDILLRLSKIEEFRSRILVIAKKRGLAT